MSGTEGARRLSSRSLQSSSRPGSDLSFVTTAFIVAVALGARVAGGRG